MAGLRILSLRFAGVISCYQVHVPISHVLVTGLIFLCSRFSMSPFMYVCTLSRCAMLLRYCGLLENNKHCAMKAYGGVEV
jgi:hypothetical protein